MKNIKTILLSSSTFFCVLSADGQTTNASVMIDNENRNAVTVAIDQPEKITSAALLQRMAKSGLKEKTKNGITRYKGVTLSEISPDKVDIYTKVEKGPNNSSIVYMSVSMGYNNFTTSVADSAITQHVRDFLEAFIKDAAYYSADAGISTQMSDVAKDEKIYQQLLDEQRDLQKKKSVIESKLVDIQNEINARAEMIQKKKSGVEDAKVKRGNIGG
ncbi:MAG: hypothetical protein ABI480_10950 [Chitinophagaceae bacterium]